MMDMWAHPHHHHDYAVRHITFTAQVTAVGGKQIILWIATMPQALYGHETATRWGINETERERHKRERERKRMNNINYIIANIRRAFEGGTTSKMKKYQCYICRQSVPWRYEHIEVCVVYINNEWQWMTMKIIENPQTIFNWWRLLLLSFPLLSQQYISTSFV